MNLPEPLLKAIDQIAEGLAKQRKRAVELVSDTEVCRYRAEDGCKCAIGMILPDELYSEELEGSGAEKLPNRDIRLLGWMEGLSVGAGLKTSPGGESLSSFQAFHDNPMDIDFMGRPTYEALLHQYRGLPDESLAAAIKEQLVTRAKQKYEAYHD